MCNIKQCWHGDHGPLTMISIESDGDVSQEYSRVHIGEMIFPSNPTPEHPLRHVITLGPLTQESIDKLAQLLDELRS